MKCAEISTGETSATPDDKNELAVRKENRADPGESEVAAAAAAKPRLHKGGGRGGRAENEGEDLFRCGSCDEKRSK